MAARNRRPAGSVHQAWQAVLGAMRGGLEDEFGEEAVKGGVEVGGEAGVRA